MSKGQSNSVISLLNGGGGYKEIASCDSFETTGATIEIQKSELDKIEYFLFMAFTSYYEAEDIKFIPKEFITSTQSNNLAGYFVRDGVNGRYFMHSIQIDENLFKIDVRISNNPDEYEVSRCALVAKYKE